MELAKNTRARNLEVLRGKKNTANSKRGEKT